MSRIPLTWLIIGICAALLLPTIFMRGMFFDGIMYANVSMNFASGEGTFWEPKCTNTVMAICHEQPPLFFMLQGTFFYVLGNSFLTERIYDLVAALLSVWLLLKVMKATGHGQSGWMAVLCWMIMPVTFWAFHNNVIEGTLSVFTLAATLHLMRALHEGKHETLHLVMAGVWIIAAGLTKGVQGMFLVAAPGLWWLIMRRSTFLDAVRQTVLVLAVPLATVAFCWFNEAAHRSFAAYFESRFVSTFAGLNNTGTGRFHQLYELFLNTLPVVAIAAVLFLLMRKKAVAARNNRLTLFMLAAGLSGILPLMVTLEQRGFYLVTALPLIALGCAIFLHPYTVALQQKLAQKITVSRILTVAGAAMLAGAVVAMVALAGTYKRDENKLRDLETVAGIVPPGSILGRSTGGTDWTLLQSAWRFHKLSMATPETPAPEWMILPRGEQAPEDYEIVDCGLREMELWRRK
ncbi:MAG: glycosyltransferase family 39 protein [Bacteroidia bacterium]|jgi:4-amino-4-deoxy-L-arabinose transferase-like glycosyltransferase|nr:glycosyltransferase family 39 protein [Bacteroidia bacterium]